jgi:BASS family bile acid:Na+ symporter
MLTTKFFPVFSSKLHKVMGKISFLFLLMFIAGALAANYQHFISHIEIILKISFLTNILVLLTGFLCAKAFALNGQDTRAVVFVMGIRNVALGLALVFQFFEGMGGMAIIVAWWGVSQISMELILISILKYIDTRKRVIA